MTLEEDRTAFFLALDALRRAKIAHRECTNAMTPSAAENEPARYQILLRQEPALEAAAAGATATANLAMAALLTHAGTRPTRFHLAASNAVYEALLEREPKDDDRSVLESDPKDYAIQNTIQAGRNARMEARVERLPPGKPRFAGRPGQARQRVRSPGCY